MKKKNLTKAVAWAIATFYSYAYSQGVATHEQPTQEEKDGVWDAIYLDGFDKEAVEKETELQWRIIYLHFQARR